MLCSYGNQVETSLSSFGKHVSIEALGVEEKEELKNLLSGVNSPFM